MTINADRFFSAPLLAATWIALTGDHWAPDNH
jgi:hypothetical protein